VQQIELSLSEPADHLALDEALLLAADANGIGETIRTWAFGSPTVVVGRSSRVDIEVDRTLCDREGIPILRRCSGGASIVGGPGCLMYSVILSLVGQPELRKIDAAHRYVMQRVLAALQNQIPKVAFQGTSDLTWENRKFSGNSLRISRQHLLYHGTVLHQSDLDLIGRCLLHAPRQPDYRKGRNHQEFVTNLPIDPIQLTVDLVHQFQATAMEADGNAIATIQTAMGQLRRDRYDDPAWHFRH